LFFPSGDPSFLLFSVVPSSDRDAKVQGCFFISKYTPQKNLEKICQQHLTS